MQRWRLTTIRGEAASVDLGGQKVTIGRHPENTICLTDEKASRYHCVVQPYGAGAYIVRDLESRNGTKVNEAVVEEAVLQPGDVIRVGAHEFLVEVGEDADPGDSRAEMEAPASARELSWVAELTNVMSALPPKEAAPEELSLLDARGEPSAALSGASDGPTAVRMLFQAASKARATDIHVEPNPEVHHVRLRVDGQMAPLVDLPTRVGELVFGLIKTACEMRGAARDAMQEGHFSARFPDRRVEMRVSFTPSVHGQKLVVRLLDQRGTPQSLFELGLPGYAYERVKRTCAQDHGLLLTCGPTGSGKTTTLYNAIREIDRTARNVVTIEDPVEYKIEGVTQIPVDEGREKTFGLLLRSILRQDPDVILVGEIRDESTARTAMQAAMTGHLVFSSVHAKDSITAVFRLMDLKVEPYLVANSLDLVLAQRLVRALCEWCRRALPVAPGQASRMGRYLGGKTEVYVATGCARCLRTGYRGRRALFELLDVNDELRDVILKEPTIAAMRRVIEAGLFTTLAQSGWKLVSEGVTTLDEVDHVTGGAR